MGIRSDRESSDVFPDSRKVRSLYQKTSFLKKDLSYDYSSMQLGYNYCKKEIEEIYKVLSKYGYRFIFQYYCDLIYYGSWKARIIPVFSSCTMFSFAKYDSTGHASSR